MPNKNTKTTIKKNILLNLFLGFSIYQFILHLFYLLSSKDPRLLIPTAVSFVHDLLLLSIYSFIYYLVCNLLPSKLKAIAEKTFIIGFLILGCGLSLYPKSLREILVFPINIFESDLAHLKH